MKMQKSIALKNAIIVATGLIIGTVSFAAGAAGNADTEIDAQMIYQSRSINHSIYSYVSKMAGEVITEPKLIYISQANGPAIHGYDHSGIKKEVPWNVEYVDTAYGPAIYSYEMPQFNGEVKVLPTVVVD